MKTVEARNRYQREWAKRNPEKVKAIKAKWLQSNREQRNAARRAERAANREKFKAYKKKWEAAHPEQVAAAHALRRLRKLRSRQKDSLKKYDFTLEQYHDLLAIQGHRCAICGRKEGNDRGFRLAIDHDHKTGIVRGLLCNRCNSALGYFGDSPKRLRKAAAYVENWRGKLSPLSAGGFQPILGGISQAPSQARRDEGMGQIEADKRAS